LDGDMRAPQQNGVPARALGPAGARVRPQIGVGRIYRGRYENQARARVPVSGLPGELTSARSARSFAPLGRKRSLRGIDRLSALSGGPLLCLFFPLGQAVIAIGSKAVPVLLLAIGPGHRQTTDLARLAQTEDLPRVARRQVAAAPLGEAPLRLTADL